MYLVMITYKQMSHGLNFEKDSKLRYNKINLHSVVIFYERNPIIMMMRFNIVDLIRLRHLLYYIYILNLCSIVVKVIIV